MPESSRPHPLKRPLCPGRLLGTALLLGIAGCGPRLDAPPVSVVFFTAFATALDGDAQTVIGHVAADAKANPRRGLVVQGFSDRTITTPAQSRTIAEQRAQSVADALMAQGVDKSRIILRPRGGTPADPGIESRRVDITFGS